VANLTQSRKRVRQATKNRQRNMSLRSAVRTAIKKVIKAIESGNQQSAQQAFTTAQPLIDSCVNKGILHKNKAARTKSRLNSAIYQLAAA
jgi:small subunit ribosomal protein S20